MGCAVATTFANTASTETNLNFEPYKPVCRLHCISSNCVYSFFVEARVLEDAGERDSCPPDQRVLALYSGDGIMGTDHRRPHPLMDHRC